MAIDNRLTACPLYRSACCFSGPPGICCRVSFAPVFQTPWWSIHSTFSIVTVGSLTLGPYRTSLTIDCSTAECIYKRRWLPRPVSITSKSSRPTSDLSIQNNGGAPAVFGQTARTTDDDAKLIFGTVFSLRNMVRKLGGEDDK